jgi:Zn-finger nucleic acid-binding protein
MKLKRRMFSPKVAVEIDECPACGGFWLDAGELQQIRLTKNYIERAEQQQNGMSPAAIRALYRLKTADRGDS